MYMDMDSKGRISLMEITAEEGQLLADGLRQVNESQISSRLQILIDIINSADNELHR